MKKILYLSYDGMTDPLGQGQVLSYLAGLAVKGHSITLISFEKQEKYRKDRDLIASLCDKAGIDWHPLSYTKSPPVFSTLYDVKRMMDTCRKLYRRKKFDIIHCRGYIPALAGLALKRKFNTRFVFDMRGFWIDEKSEGEGGWNPDSFIYGKIIHFLRKKEMQFYTTSDRIVTLTHAAAKMIVSRYPSLADKITVIPTCVNLDIFTAFNTETKNATRKKLGIPGDAFVLLYSGGAGPNYDNVFLIKAFERIKQLYKEPWLLVLSKDGTNGLEAAGMSDLSRVISVSVPYREVGNYLMAGDAGIVNYTKGLSVAGRSPTKLGEYWACGLPALAPAGIGDVDELFFTYKNSGLIIEDYNFNSLSPSTFTDVHKHILREYATAYFGLAKGINKYHDLYNDL